MAIGNAPWPIGVTMVGIHARTGREKIFSKHVAHVLNDETQRKYIQVSSLEGKTLVWRLTLSRSISVNFESKRITANRMTQHDQVHVHFADNLCIRTFTE